MMGTSFDEGHETRVEATREPHMPDRGWRWDTVMGMIARRYKIDPALNGRPHPRHWIGRDVWPEPEYLIYLVLRSIALLERDGMGEAAAIRQVDARLRLNVLATGVDAVPAETYLVEVLSAFAPSYLEHGTELLAKTIARARKGLRKLPPAPWTTPNGCPPSDWHWQRVPQPLARKEFRAMGARLRRVPTSIYDEELADLVVRRQRGDQLWHWSSPPITWGAMIGRGGIALVRNGRVLCDVTTMMN